MLNNTIRIIENAQTQQYMQESKRRRLANRAGTVRRLAMRTVEMGGYKKS